MRSRSISLCLFGIRNDERFSMGRDCWQNRKSCTTTIIRWHSILRQSIYTKIRKHVIRRTVLNLIRRNKVIVKDPKLPTFPILWKIIKCHGIPLKLSTHVQRLGRILIIAIAASTEIVNKRLKNRIIDHSTVSTSKYRQFPGWLMLLLLLEENLSVTRTNDIMYIVHENQMFPSLFFESCPPPLSLSLPFYHLLLLALVSVENWKLRIRE